MEANSETKVQQLQANGNLCYASGRYTDAAKIYSYIIDSCSGRVTPDTIRIVRCNRAACYNELEKYQLAAEDCGRVLSNPCPAQSESITLKAHLRLARSFFGLGELELATDQLDKFRELNGMPGAAELSLRVRILEEQVAQDCVADELRAPMRLMHFVVRVGRVAPIIIEDQVPAVLCSTNPPRIPTNAFLAHLVQKHDHHIRHSREWTCWKCPAKAVSLVHTPCAYLHLQEPIVVDIVQAVCVQGGECEMQARALMASQMEKLNRSTKEA
ncbi:hypothetical protein Hypma_004350 [Hypsizygus marmoreus]|uniref:Uncharacterized protein n=1 Tax=Hypsizygus marmoreus TaxID=39966 RepID=A0A369K3Q1_HYPMA|nr:hypothetical protein Hypma_004350 [Hypsizygus marmoreus]